MFSFIYVNLYVMIKLIKVKSEFGRKHFIWWVYRRLNRWHRYHPVGRSFPTDPQSGVDVASTRLPAPCYGVALLYHSRKRVVVGEGCTPSPSPLQRAPLNLGIRGATPPTNPAKLKLFCTPWSDFDPVRHFCHSIGTLGLFESPVLCGP